MTVRAVLAGTSDSVRAALAAAPNWAALRLEIGGAALVGGGEADIPVLTRAPAWEALAVEETGAGAVILVGAPPSVSARRRLLARAAETRMRVYLLDDGRVRPLALDDLVGAPLGEMDWARIRARIAGKRVLITGGGGSIGAALARRVAALAPARLTLLDSSEYNLFKISLELRDAALALADIRDRGAVARWFAREKPDIVFHTAALKQVPLVEQFPSEGILTNVSGLRNVAEAARTAGADMIFVSTDKAVDPSGVMGASKRLGELYCQALDRGAHPRAIPVRLGNVLGSTGSVAPIFEAQFAAGGPLTVTDPSVTRFFLSIPQAADVLLQAAAIGLNADSPRGAALVIDMGEALPVVELARDVIRLNGLKPEEDMAITFVGMRPGEKLHEQLISATETARPCGDGGVEAAMSAPRGLAEITEIMDRLAMLARAGDGAAIVEDLFAALALPAPPESLSAARA
jgi:O-antigen biosynthesis protein WbqV